MDARLGCLSVHLDTPQCFSAEIYAVDLNVSGAQEDLKVCTTTYYYVYWLHLFSHFSLRNFVKPIVQFLLLSVLARAFLY